MNLDLILASTSPFRYELLQRLHLSFQTFAPNIDESPLPDETPAAWVQRLAVQKAQAAQQRYPRALIIGSDQMAVMGDEILGKPHNHYNAVKQLKKASGQQIDFLTGLSLLNSESGEIQTDMVKFSVVFRTLTDAQIENYLYKDQPYHCAGSFKSEGLGITLLERVEGTDPTAVIGLPLIRLTRMLEQQGMNII